MPESASLLTPPQLAERLQVSRETITSWARRGKIPCVRLSLVTRRFHWGSVCRALNIPRGTSDRRPPAPRSRGCEGTRGQREDCLEIHADGALCTVRVTNNSPRIAPEDLRAFISERKTNGMSEAILE